MRQISRFFPVCLVMPLLYMMTACSKPESHVAKINLTNDLGRQAELSLCKDVLHCGSISDLWTPTQIDVKSSESFTVSNEEMTVFKVSSKIDGKTDVRCLRILPDKSHKVSGKVLLSSAVDC